MKQVMNNTVQAGHEILPSKMMQRSKLLLTQFHIGQNTTIRGPKFNRGPSESRKLSEEFLGKKMISMRLDAEKVD